MHTANMSNHIFQWGLVDTQFQVLLFTTCVCYLLKLISMVLLRPHSQACLAVSLKYHILLYLCMKMISVMISLNGHQLHIRVIMHSAIS